MKKKNSLDFLMFFKALRIHQWLKNILVFIPILAAFQFDYNTINYSLLSFLSFCFMSSSVYLINDIFDLKFDKKHPQKKNRPLASGNISLKSYKIFIFFLFVISLSTALLINITFTFLILFYFCISFSYSYIFKRFSIIDLCILASLYTLRIVAGSEAVSIDISFWLVVFSVFIFLSLSSVKRQAELVNLKKIKILKIYGRDYMIDDLLLITTISISSGLISILVLILYINDPSVIDLYSKPQAFWVICFILLFWLLRMIFIAHRGKINDDPVTFAAKDKTSQICFVIVLFLFLMSKILI